MFKCCSFSIFVVLQIYNQKIWFQHGSIHFISRSFFLMLFLFLLPVLSWYPGWSAQVWNPSNLRSRAWSVAVERLVPAKVMCCSKLHVTYLYIQYICILFDNFVYVSFMWDQCSFWSPSTWVMLSCKENDRNDNTICLITLTCLYLHVHAQRNDIIHHIVLYVYYIFINILTVWLCLTCFYPNFTLWFYWKLFITCRRIRSAHLALAGAGRRSTRLGVVAAPWHGWPLAWHGATENWHRPRHGSTEKFEEHNLKFQQHLSRRLLKPEISDIRPRLWIRMFR